MAIFKLVAFDGSAEMVLRAQCISCARTVAVGHAGQEGTRVWRDPTLSSVELVREMGKTALILRADRK